jgi:hypothetical protein
MNFNFFIIVILISTALFYIKYTEIFSRYCYTHNTIKNRHKDDLTKYQNTTLYEHFHTNNTQSIKIQNIENLCKETIVDYESHVLMSMSLDKLNEAILSKEILDPDTLQQYLNSVDLINLKLSLLFLKFIYIALYVGLLYILIVIVPNYLMQVILSLFNKLLMLVFIGLFVESVLRIYFQFNTDLVSFINKTLYLEYADYFPMGYFIRLIKYVMELVNKFI